MTEAKILLVEDNPADARLVKEALRESSWPHQLMIARDGLEALAMLRREGPHASLPQPDLVLLDLNLPGRTGLEVLEEVKNDPQLRRIPVLILSTSRAIQDLRRAYDLHANCYLNKPTGWEEFCRVMQSVERFWLGLACLPKSRNTDRYA
jgi:two-component system, chemotaxis family, response regulator Rcp1